MHTHVHTYMHTQMYMYTHTHTHEINKFPPHIHKTASYTGRFVLRIVTGHNLADFLGSRVEASVFISHTLSPYISSSIIAVDLNVLPGNL